MPGPFKGEHKGSCNGGDGEPGKSANRSQSGCFTCLCGKHRGHFLMTFAGAVHPVERWGRIPHREDGQSVPSPWPEQVVEAGRMQADSFTLHALGGFTCSGFKPCVSP